MKFVAKRRDWKKGARSYGDENPIHRKCSAARRFNLEGVVAPGMWVVGHLQDEGDISSIKQIKFSGNVYNKDFLRMIAVGVSEKGNDYVFKKGDEGEEILHVKRVKFGQYSPVPSVFENVIHRYHSCITSRKLDSFLRSMGVEADENFPNMYAMALSAPALLELGGKTGLVGFHASQSFSVHRSFEVGPVEVLLSEDRTKGGMSYFNQHWVQRGKIKASGRAGVVPLELSN